MPCLLAATASSRDDGNETHGFPRVLAADPTTHHVYLGSDHTIDAEVATLHVTGHVDPPGGPLALDLVRRGDDRQVGHVAIRDQHHPRAGSY